MEEEVAINKDKSVEEIYNQLLPQIEQIINADEPIISSLLNVTAVLKDAFVKISWVGFYITKGSTFYLGPFQGKVACTVIKFGKGVCGTVAYEKETIIVDDVIKFPGHIACDSGSKSEIVVPIVVEDKIWGVLDLDSYEYSAFNEIDKLYLENICSVLIERLNLSDFSIQ